MTWQHFLRTLAIAGLGAAALVVASQAKASGGESAPISPDQAEEFLDAAAAEAAAFAKEEATAEAPEPDAKGVAKKKSKEAVASKSNKSQVSKAEEAQPEAVAKTMAALEGADQQTASLPAPLMAAGSKARLPDAARAGVLKPLIVRYASENGLPYELADAVIRLESRYNAGARNGPNMGLTQINIRTAQSLGYKGDAAGLFDAETNLRYGLKYLATAYKLAGGDTCGTILRYQFGHRTQTMTAASRAYCAKVKVITAAAD
ncbi:lytic transglycosylase domain-containing protein [Microvirga terrestris]|uniref:Lytic transglycosylase domain-containing protein n=1 Tax=Microvirga terrestris TaxID=2791024 RepID=A0ABS0HM50_9HYPH|nr:lytic transglycosylase domain-containing protein [Microvirga terrestris]MBF9194556.1 lytic transglycosylase domain-containing protein [Microvirga terrestris]